MPNELETITEIPDVYDNPVPIVNVCVPPTITLKKEVVVEGEVWVQVVAEEEKEVEVEG